MTLKYVAGCVSYGKTIEGAKANFKEALDRYQEDMRGEEELTLPEPRSREELQTLMQADIPDLADSEW